MNTRVAKRVAARTFVEIHRVVLAAGARAPQVPSDTQNVPLEMRVKGFLINDAKLGDQAEIETPAGRRLQGTLVDVLPAYTHTFGPRLEELTHIGAELRALLANRGKA